MSDVSKIFAAEDWTKLYQAYSQIDLSSYDFDNLRRVLLDYVKNNFPEDFNDFIESSEFIALIDMMAYLGQNIAFRVDLNSRENFIDTATRQDSVIRLARLVGYTPKRNIAAAGMIKLNTISTSQNISDSNGNSLTNVKVLWNDPTNSNFQEQFNTILNQAMSSNQQVGKPVRRAVVDGVVTELYEFNSLNISPVLPFSQSISGTTMNFEMVGANLTSDGTISERVPVPNSGFSLLYRNDGKGNGSPNTGWFAMFTQGTMYSTDFGINTALPNQVISVNVNNINNTDIWLFELDNNGNFTNLWKEVPQSSGTNVIYNSVSKNIRKIYSVVGRENDQIDLVFADGTFGSIPNGNFRLYYRTSNGISYQIRPTDLNAVNASLNFRSKNSTLATLNMGFSLKSTVSNSTPAEDFVSVKTNAPQSYYTQNRMITGEDYNIYPVITNQNVLKAKAVNRTSSGVNRYLDIVDPTGKYSSVMLFADDGVIYHKTINNTYNFAWSSATSDIVSIIQNKIRPYLINQELTNFYYVNFARVDFANTGIFWKALHPDSSTYDGYFVDVNGKSVAIGPEAGSYPFRIPAVGTLAKFVAPSGKFFDPNRNLTTGTPYAGCSNYLWASILSLVGDGRNYGSGALDTGAGPIVFSAKIPNGAILQEVMPQLSRDLGGLESTVFDAISSQYDFGLGYDQNTASWYYIDRRNISTSLTFDQSYAKDTTNSNKDASWLMKFQYRNASYIITTKLLQTVFHSVGQNQFYYDSGSLIKDPLTGKLVTDKINVLKTNSDWNNNNKIYLSDVDFQIIDNVQDSDGFVNVQEVRLGYVDTNGNQIPQDPDAFGRLVNLSAKVTATATATILGSKINNIVVETGGSGYVDPPAVIITGNGTGAAATAKVVDGAVSAITVTNPGSGYTAAQITIEPGLKRYGFPPTDFVVVFERYMDSSGFYRFRLYDTTNMVVVQTLTNIGTTDPAGVPYTNGQLIYARSTGKTYVWTTTTGNYAITADYLAYPGRTGLQFKYNHSAGETRRIDPAISNIIDLYVLTNTYSTNLQNWLKYDRNELTKPQPPSSQELATMLSSIELVKGMNDEIIYNPINYKVLFGSKAASELQAVFQVVKNSASLISDNEVKTRVVGAIDMFFANANYDFGDTFYFTELAAFVHLQLAGIISSIVLVPQSSNSLFGDLFQIYSRPDEILLQDVTVDNVLIVSNVTPATIMNN